MVVPTRDRPDLLSGCLEALSATLQPFDELVVVDSASTDERTREVALTRGARYVRCDRPGLSIARNAGWRTASNDLVAFVDDDVRVASDWAQAMVAALTEGPAFVTGAVTVPPGQEGVDRPVAVAAHPERLHIDAGATGSWGHGANMGTRRSVLTEVGGFDEILGAGARFPAAEDYDFFDRVLARGATGNFDPTVRAWHEQWRERRQLVGLDHGYGRGAGARVSKLLRSNAPGARRRGLHEARTYLWSIGVADAGRCLFHGREWGALFALARASGFLRGLVAGFLVPVHGEHLGTAHP